MQNERVELKSEVKRCECTVEEEKKYRTKVEGTKEQQRSKNSMHMYSVHMLILNAKDTWMTASSTGVGWHLCIDVITII